MDDLKTRIKKMIVERLFLSVDPSKIRDSEPLMETYNIDSVALFEIAVGLEDEFDVSMEDVNFSPDSFRTVNDIADLITQKGGA